MGSQSKRDDINPRFGDDIIEILPIEDLDEVLLDEKDPTKVIKVGKELKVETKIILMEFLKNTQDVFAWSHKDMVEISPSVISHILNVDKNFLPVQQKR